MNYIPDPCFHEAIKKLKGFVEKYADEEHLEIEVRLGYLEDDEFKTDVGKDFFDRITNRLLECETLSSMNYERSEDFFWNGRRLSITEPPEDATATQKKEAAKGTCIKKIKLAIFDFMFEGSGFDLRVSFSKEVPSKRYAKEKATYKRKKERNSYHWKHLSFDLTTVTMEDNTIENHLYEVELETEKLDLTKMTSHYFVHDLLLKVKDMVEMCEPLEDEPKVVFIKEKIF